VATRLLAKRNVAKNGKAIHVTAEELDRFAMEHALRYESNVEMFLHHPTLKVDYEDLLEERNAALNRAQRFLGVEPIALEASVQRQNPEPLSELIANYRELRRELDGSPLAAHLDS
jgi:hypothetical protein